MGALLGTQATAGLNAAEIGLAWGQTIVAGTYEVGAPDLENNPVRNETIDRAYALADTPTTNAQFAAGLRQLEGRTTVLMTTLPKNRWAILARGTEEEIREIDMKRLTEIVVSLVPQQPSFIKVGDYFASGALRAFDLGEAPMIRIVPVTLEAHFPEGFDRPNQPALTSPFESSAFAALFGLELPTGVEWEVAAADLRDERYRNEKNLRRVAHFHPTRATADVKTKEPNELGYFDMLGNTWEAMANPYIEGEENREFRGGCWFNRPERVRAAIRYGSHPDGWDNDRGFRLLRFQDSPG